MTPEQIRSARVGLGLSQEQFAALLGVSFVSVNRWEANKAKPSVRHVRQMERALKVQPASVQPVAGPLRPVHYLGSKLRLADVIVQAVEEVAKDRGAVCDLFAGSGTVSHALAALRPVVSVDIQQYSRVLTSALVSPMYPSFPTFEDLERSISCSEHRDALRRAMEPLVTYEERCIDVARLGQPDAICDLVEFASIYSYEAEGAEWARPEHQATLAECTKRLAEDPFLRDAGSLTSRYFGGLYFSYAQAVEIDVLLHIVDAYPPEVRDVMLAAVLSTASEIVNTVGKQFAQPIKLRDSSGKPKSNLIGQTLRDRSYDVWTLFGAWLRRYLELPRPLDKLHTFKCEDYRQFLATYEGPLSVIYADPPYTRDHYSRFYHVLETLCLRDVPDVSKMRRQGVPRIMRGLYREDRHQSPFCIKSQAPEAFRNLFEGARRFNAPLILSYSPFNAADDAHPRMMSVDELKVLAQQSFRQVEVRSVGRFVHSKLNAEWLHKKAGEESEVLLLCRP